MESIRTRVILDDGADIHETWTFHPRPSSHSAPRRRRPLLRKIHFPYASSARGELLGCSIKAAAYSSGPANDFVEVFVSFEGNFFLLFVDWRAWRLWKVFFRKDSFGAVFQLLQENSFLCLWFTTFKLLFENTSRKAPPSCTRPVCGSLKLLKIPRETN